MEVLYPRCAGFDMHKKTVKDTNLKLGDVVSDIMGKASRFILSALAEGETDASTFAQFAVGRVQASEEELKAASFRSRWLKDTVPSGEL